MTISTVIQNVANEAGYTVETNILASNEVTFKWFCFFHQNFQPLIQKRCFFISKIK